MPVKKEICRNFARGSCHFGQRCRFLHVSPQSQQQQQQQHRSNFNNNNNNNNNIFSQQSQHNHSNNNNSNPYGFGVQNNSHPKGFSQTQPKAFENTWNRFSTNTSSAPPSRQSENHKCTDAESCRRIIVEDFENERPVWKLTCYGHWKGIPCDIVGDISYEELRAASYEDAKCGVGLQSIVEKERNLLNSKLVEFENLCKPRAELPNLNLPPPNNAIAPNVFSQIPAPAPVSSFSQLGTSNNLGFGSRSNNTFGQPNPFGGFAQMKNFSSESQASNPYASVSTPPSNSVSTQSAGDFGIFKSNSPNVPSIREVVVQANQRESPGIDTVWLKEKWNPGEVPEEAPPDTVCS